MQGIGDSSVPGALTRLFSILWKPIQLSFDAVTDASLIRWLVVTFLMTDAQPSLG